MMGLVSLYEETSELASRPDPLLGEDTEKIAICKLERWPWEELQDGGRVRRRDHLPPQKYIYMWNNSYRTPAECWQKTSDLAKGKKLPHTWVG